MREVETPVTKLIVPGLRTDNRVGKNQAGLTQLVNAVPKNGMLYFPTIEDSPISAREALTDWPFPTMLKSATGLYLGTRHYLYSVSSSYTLIALTAWFSSAEHWEVADFGLFLVFHNGNLAIILDVPSGDHRFDATFPVCKTILNYRGQLVIGNTADGENFVRWGKIGSYDFTVDGSNEAGYMPMPSKGAVQRLMYMKSGVDRSGRDAGVIVVYTTDGVYELVPFDLPTFGLRVVNGIYGIPSWGCVAGTQDEQVFIDTLGYLHHLSAKGDNKLGYREFLEPLLQDSPLITYEPIDDNWYISTEEQCFLFNKTGLGQLSQIVTSGWLGDKFYVLGSKPSTLTISLGSDTIDFNIRASKLISVITTGLETDGTVQLGVSFLNQATKLFVGPIWFPLSPNGTCFPSVAGTDFRLHLQVMNFTYFRLSEMFVRWKLIDKSAIRGTYGYSKATSSAD